MAIRPEVVQDMRERGRMCQYCPRLLDVMSWHGGLRTCDRCARPQPVTLKFKMEECVWRLDFLHPTTSFPLAPTLRLGDSGKLRELISRTPTRWTLGERQAFEFGLIVGTGRCDIQMTMEQLVAVKERHRRGMSHESRIEGGRTES